MQNSMNSLLIDKNMNKEGMPELKLMLKLKLPVRMTTTMRMMPGWWPSREKYAFEMLLVMVRGEVVERSDQCCR